MSNVVSLHDAVAERGRLAANDKTVVFTNGCFDLLHVGHVRALEEARALGDALIVAVNSDGSVRRLKGAGRPVVPAAERAEIVGALECVDLVTIFDDSGPERLLAILKPDVHCKGGDYASADLLPEAALVGAFGGRVALVSHTAGRSTSALLRAIARRAIP
jgi:rfaE bifunctional protein nucleotidyltransferase chain/domain